MDQITVIPSETDYKRSERHKAGIQPENRMAWFSPPRRSAFKKANPSGAVLRATSRPRLDSVQGEQILPARSCSVERARFAFSSHVNYFPGLPRAAHRLLSGRRPLITRE